MYTNRHQGKQPESSSTRAEPPPTHNRPLKESVFSECLLCPILQERMNDPVIAADGYTYERKAITAWISSRGARAISPMTGVRLAHLVLQENIFARQIIMHYRDSKPERKQRKITEQDILLSIQLREEELTAMLEKQGKQLEDITRERDKVSKQLKPHIRENDKLKQRNDKLTQENDALKRENTRIKKKNAKLFHEIERLKSTTITTNNQPMAALSECAQASQRISLLKAKLSQGNHGESVEGLTNTKVSLQALLVHACYEADLEQVKELVEQKGAELTKCDHQGQSPLAAAIWGLSLNIMDYLGSQIHYTRQDWHEAATYVQERHRIVIPMRKKIVTYADWYAHYVENDAPWLYDYIRAKKRGFVGGYGEGYGWVKEIQMDSSDVMHRLELQSIEMPGQYWEAYRIEMISRNPTANEKQAVKNGEKMLIIKRQGQFYFGFRHGERNSYHEIAIGKQRHAKMYNMLLKHGTIGEIKHIETKQKLFDTAKLYGGNIDVTYMNRLTVPVALLQREIICPLIGYGEVEQFRELCAAMANRLQAKGVELSENYQLKTSVTTNVKVQKQKVQQHDVLDKQKQPTLSSEALVQTTTNVGSSRSSSSSIQRNMLLESTNQDESSSQVEWQDRLIEACYAAELEQVKQLVEERYANFLMPDYTRQQALGAAIWGLSLEVVDYLESNIRYTREDWFNAVSSLQKLHGVVLPIQKSIVTYGDWCEHYESKLAPWFYDYKNVQRRRVYKAKQILDLSDIDMSKNGWIHYLDRACPPYIFVDECKEWPKVNSKRSYHYKDDIDYSYVDGKQINYLKKLCSTIVSLLRERGIQLSGNYRLEEQRALILNPHKKDCQKRRPQHGLLFQSTSEIDSSPSTLSSSSRGQSVLKSNKGLTLSQMDLQNQLVIACYNADVDKVKELIERHGADPVIPDRDHEQPMGAAIWRLSFKVMDYLESKIKYTKDDWLEIVSEIQLCRGIVLPMRKNIVTYEDWLEHAYGFKQDAVWLYDWEQVNRRCNDTNKIKHNEFIHITHDKHAPSRYILPEFINPSLPLFEFRGARFGSIPQIKFLKSCCTTMTNRLREHGVELSENYQLKGAVSTILKPQKEKSEQVNRLEKSQQDRLPQSFLFQSKSISGNTSASSSSQLQTALKSNQSLSIEALALQKQLTEACYNADLERVKELIEQQGADPAIAAQTGQQPLAAAIWGLSLEVIDYLESKVGYTEQDWINVVSSLENEQGVVLPLRRNILTYGDWLEHYKSGDAPWFYDYDLAQKRFGQDKEDRIYDLQKWCVGLYAEDINHVQQKLIDIASRGDRFSPSYMKRQIAYGDVAVVFFRHLCLTMANRLKERGVYLSENCQIERQAAENTTICNAM